jgi:cytochrome P450
MLVQALGVVLQSNKYWKEPDVFDPTRFLVNETASGESPATQWAFRPFGVGNRMCPASKYLYYYVKER